MQDEVDADAILAEGPKTGNKLHDESVQIISALGGTKNIGTVSACATRLRVSVKDKTKVDDKVFKALGAPGVLKVADGIQAIFGGKADLYSQEINEILASNSFVTSAKSYIEAVSYTHLTLPTITVRCRSRWSPYH